MHRKIEIKEKEKMDGSDKHILAAKTLSKAAEVNDNLDERGREIHKMMRKLTLSKREKRFKE
ncbi:MAG: hypothetical protein V5A88_06900 [Candidatus Thermoplasmatota archaeon]